MLYHICSSCGTKSKRVPWYLSKDEQLQKLQWQSLPSAVGMPNRIYCQECSKQQPQYVPPAAPSPGTTYHCDICDCESKTVPDNLTLTQGLSKLGWARRRVQCDDKVVRRIFCRRCSRRYQFIGVGQYSQLNDLRADAGAQPAAAPKVEPKRTCRCGLSIDTSLKVAGWHQHKVNGKFKPFCGECSVAYLKERWLEQYKARSLKIGRKPLTSKVDKADAIRMRAEGHTLLDVAQKYGVTRERIRQITRKVELTKKFCRKCRCEMDVAAQGWICETCQKEKRDAAMYNKCACGARKIIKNAHCMKCAGKVRRKYDFDDAVYLYDNGLSAVCIAKYYGVIPPAIYRVLRLANRPSMHNCLYLDDIAIMAMLADKHGKTERPEVL